MAMSTSGNDKTLERGGSQPLFDGGITPNSDTISINSMPTKRGNGRTYIDPITFPLNGCKSESLWRETILAIDNKRRTSALYRLKDCVSNGLFTSDVATKILRSSVSSLSEQDIGRLYDLVEDYISSKKSIIDKNNTSGAIRVIFCMVGKPLINGDLIDSIKYRTRFPLHNKTPRSIISEQPDPSFSDPELAAPISTLRFSSEKELQKKMVKHLEARNKRVEDACLSVVREYLEWREILSEIKSQPIPKKMREMDVCTFNHLGRTEEFARGYNPKEKLQLYLYAVEKFEFNKFGEHRRFKNSKAGRALHGLFSDDFIETYPQIKKYGAPIGIIALLSDYYIPANVLYAMQKLLQLWFAFNNDTVKQMRVTDIKADRKNRYISLTPVKEKTDRQQEGEIDRHKENDRADIIDLILWHHENITHFHKTTTKSVWATLINMTKAAVLCDPAHIHKKFIAENNLPWFTSEQLRDQALCTELAKNGDPFEAMRLAGHASLSTLIHYADQSILRIANEANIHEFQQQLNDCIVWAVRGKDESKRRGINIDSVNKRLFFPVSDMGYEDELPEVDELIKSIKNNKNSPVILTEERIEWCLRQHFYYSKRWEFLNRANPERFKFVHLPKIIFTSALLQVIKDKQPKEFKRILSLLPTN